MIHEELIDRELFVGAGLQVRLEVILEDIILVGTWQCILERYDVDFIKLRGLIPICEDLGLVRHDSEATRLRRLNLEVDIPDLKHLVGVEKPHSLAFWGTVRSVIPLEVRNHEVREDLLRRHFIRTPCAELYLLEVNYFAAIEIVICVDPQSAFLGIALDDGKIHIAFLQHIASSDDLTRNPFPPQLRRQQLQALGCLAVHGRLANRQNVKPPQLLNLARSSGRSDLLRRSAGLPCGSLPRGALGHHDVEEPLPGG
mmetsp:Transcript_97098/g.243439  ORF Transcript_97098/g.243439 Transcript_97098/m.243439 type:complete len:256 (-) Transcript_97098:66-833(-)